MRRRGLIAVLLVLALVVAPAAFAAKDSDKDGLPNSWENGKTPSGLSLKKLGASPKHKDIFVEVDFANSVARSEVSCGTLDALVNAFKNAPVTNPDKKKGVRLHIDAGKRCPSRSYDRGGSSRFSTPPSCATLLDNGSGMKLKRLKVFHQASIVDAICGGPSGQASSTDFIVDVDGGGGFAHVFMHELGHTLGLDHGNLNSFSVMSKVLTRYPSQSQAIDFNRYRIEALDEAALSEENGLQSSPAGEAYLAGFYPQFYCFDSTIPGPAYTAPESGANANVDWDCDGYPFWMPPPQIDTGTVSADIDGDGDTTSVIPAALSEWARLRYGQGRIGP